MRWLVTTTKAVAVRRLDKALAAADARRIDERPPILLGVDEQSWEVEGPPDLDRKLAGVRPVRDVYPSSTVTLY